MTAGVIPLLTPGSACLRRFPCAMFVLSRHATGRSGIEAGAIHPLAGQLSIDDLLRDRYDLTPQLPLYWTQYETTAQDPRPDVRAK